MIWNLNASITTTRPLPSTVTPAGSLKRSFADACRASIDSGFVRSGTVPASQIRRARGVELAHSVVLRVGNVDVVRVVEAGAPGAVELKLARTARAEREEGLARGHIEHAEATLASAATRVSFAAILFAPGTLHDCLMPASAVS